MDFWFFLYKFLTFPNPQIRTKKYLNSQSRKKKKATFVLLHISNFIQKACSKTHKTLFFLFLKSSFMVTKFLETHKSVEKFNEMKWIESITHCFVGLGCVLCWNIEFSAFLQLCCLFSILWGGFGKISQVHNVWYNFNDQCKIDQLLQTWIFKFRGLFA